MDKLFEIKYQSRETGEQFTMEARSRDEAEELAQELFEDGWAVVPKIFEIYDRR